jgi:hypothetical protein
VAARSGLKHCISNVAYHPRFFLSSEIDMAAKPARFLTFKCKQCGKPVQVRLQQVSACSHIQPYQGICKCGEVMRHATGDKEAVAAYLDSPLGSWTHHHH